MTRKWLSRKEVWITSSLLLAVSVGLLGIVLAHQERTLPSPRGMSFVRMLQANGPRSQAFVMTDERHVGPDPELYHPFPESNGLLQVPPEVMLAARRYEKSCDQKDLARADAESRSRLLNPSKLLDWHRAVCEKSFERFRFWLERTPFIHPSGASYARMFYEAVGELSADERYFHVSERIGQSEFDRWFVGLPKDDQLNLLKTFRVVPVGDQLVVAGEWDGSSREISVFQIESVRQWLLNQVSYEVALATKSPRCDFKQFGLCFFESREGVIGWKKRWTETALVWLTSTFFLLTGLVLFMRRSDQRRREAEQALLFQVISHELRTPFTALTLSTDGLRTQFDRMNEKGQQHLMRVLDATRDLDKIVSRTLAQMKNENDTRVFDLCEATDAIIEKKFAGLVDFEPTGGPVVIEFSDFWYEICLTNLIRNALLHGQRPVTVEVRRAGNTAQVQVQDAGQATLSDVKAFRRTLFRKRSTKGLGIGLRIVHRKMREMGGDLKAYAAPTRFVLEFKCEEHK